ncbi:hypothetical protein ACQY0O_000808 [Thecaphora frezii]
MVPAPAPVPGALAGSHSSSPFAIAILAANAQYEATDASKEAPRISLAMDQRGDFNGSCGKHEASPISPETPPGSCASYFPDVTDYCCAAVGGVYNATFSVGNASTEILAALDHPICQTSNYADMFSCYQFVTEAHCSATTPVPYGVCKANGMDTSKSIRSTSSATRSRSTGHVKWVGLALTLLLTAPLSLIL